MVPLLLPCATTGVLHRVVREGCHPSGSRGPGLPPHGRDGLRVRCRATWCPCGRVPLRRPAPRPFLRKLPDDDHSTCHRLLQHK
jgi:hypothetical protein